MVRYQNTFKSLAGQTYRIDIEDATYIGDASEFKTDRTGFKISYKGLAQRLDPIMASDCQLTFYVENTTHEAFITSIINSQEERFGVQIYKNSTIIWRGILVNDGIEIPDEYFPYAVTLKFTDGLGRLSDKYYNQTGKKDSTTPYTGTNTVLGHILKCLSYTGTKQYHTATSNYLKTVCNYFEIRHRGFAYNPLVETRLNHYAFYTLNEEGVYEWMTCQDVLINVLQCFNLTIKMYNGIYHVVQSSNLTNSSLRSFTYDYGETQRASSNDDSGYRVSSSALTRMTGGITKFLAPLQRVSTKYKYRYSNGANDNLIPVQDSYTTAVSFLNNLFVTINNEYLTFNGSVREIYYTPYASTVSPNFRAVFKLRVTYQCGATYYYLKGGGGDEGISWTTNSGDYVKLVGTLDNSGWSWINDTQFEFNTDTLPGEGVATFQFTRIGFENENGASYTPPAYSTYSFICKGFAMVLHAADRELYGESEIYNTNGTNPASTQSLELKGTTIGDGPFKYSLGRLETYNGSTWANSSLWKNDMSTSSYDYSIWMLVTRHILTGQQVAAWCFQGSFNGIGLGPEKTIMWNGKFLVPMQYEMYPHEDSCTGMWFDAAISAFGGTTGGGIAEDEAMMNDSDTWNDTGGNEIPVITETVYDVKNETPSPGSVQSYAQKESRVTVNITEQDKTADFNVVIPAGYLLENVIIENQTASACKLSFGTTSSGTEVYGGFSIASSELITMTVNKLFSASADTTIYVNSDNLGDTWNSCTVSFYIMLRKIK